MINGLLCLRMFPVIMLETKPTLLSFHERFMS